MSSTPANGSGFEWFWNGSKRQPVVLKMELVDICRPLAAEGVLQSAQLQT